MKFVVLGATGATGLEIVKQALERGHYVTAFVRSPERLNGLTHRIAVIQGDLLNSAELVRGIAGHDAVLSGFGPRVPISKADRDLLRRFAMALTMAMRHANVSRAVVESVAFLFKDSIVPPAYLAGRLFFRDLVADAAAMEDILAKSGLEWTIVRPPKLTEKPRTGRYRVREGHLPRFGFSISRADVADFMIRAAENHVGPQNCGGVQLNRTAQVDHPKGSWNM